MNNNKTCVCVTCDLAAITRFFLMSCGRSGVARSSTWEGGISRVQTDSCLSLSDSERSADEIYDPVQQCPLFWRTTSEYFLFYLHFWHRRPPETTT